MLTNFDLLRLSQEYDIPLVHICFKDQLKNFPPPSFGGIIVNLDNSVDANGKMNFGTHYVCIFFDIQGHRNSCAYFDPFGFIPPTVVMNYLQNFIPYPYSKQMIQDTRSGVCGWYCLMFIKCMSQYPRSSIITRLSDFLNYFNWTNLGKNKSIVEKFFHRKTIH